MLSFEPIHEKEVFQFVDSPMGEITLSGTSKGLTGLWLPGQRGSVATLSPDISPGNLPVFEETVRWLELYFQGNIPNFTPDLNPQGSKFRQRVWELLLKIPYGETVSYGDIASVIAAERGISRMSAQAVGGAVGHNPISIIIPCHRVIGSDGSLTGYGGGLDKKIRLLGIEGIPYRL